MKRETVAIVGLGLIGGSLALALSRAGYRVRGWDRDPEAVRTAVDRGAIVDEGDDLAAVIRGSEVTVLAVPVPAIPGVAGRIAGLLDPGAVVMDVGGSKRWVLSELNAIIPAACGLVGGHPMSGSERAGIDAADPDLFRGRPFVICPVAGRTPEAAIVASRLARDAGGLPVMMSAHDHDLAVAVTSHLPYLVAGAVARVVGARHCSHPATGQLIAGGYLDTTRVAACPLEMGAGMVQGNADLVREALDSVIRELSDVRDRLTDHDQLIEWLAGAKHSRLAVVGSDEDG